MRHWDGMPDGDPGRRPGSTNATLGPLHTGGVGRNPLASPFLLRAPRVSTENQPLGKPSMSACKPTGGPSRGRGPDAGQRVQPERLDLGESLGVCQALKSPCLPGPGSLIVPFPGGFSLGDGRRRGRAFPCPSASPGDGITGLGRGAGSPQLPPPAVGTACFSPRGRRPQGPGVPVHGVTLPPPGPELGPIPPGLRALPSPWGVSGSPSFLPAGRTPSVGFLPFPLRAQALPACWGWVEGAWTCRKTPELRILSVGISLVVQGLSL